VPAPIEDDLSKGILEAIDTGMMKDNTELFKQFMDNEGFRRWLTDTVFAMTYG
jgi:type I restriction enzyme R subunit